MTKRHRTVDGFLDSLDGNPPIRYRDTVWDDYEFPMTSVRINPATSKPDFDFDTVDLLFDKDSTETVVGNGQLPHSWKIASSLMPHVHWTQKAAGVVVWQLEYKIWDETGVEPSGFTTITTSTVINAYTSGDIAQISTFAAIDLSAITAVSPTIKVRLSRLGGDGSDTYDQDAATQKFDFHRENDTPGGSHAEYSKD